MKKLITIHLAFIISIFADAQSIRFNRTYGGSDVDLGQTVCQTIDGGYIFSGRTSSFGHGQEDAYIVKTNAFGDTLWTKALGGPLNDYGYTIKPSGDAGGYLVSGHSDSYGPCDCQGLFFKTDSMGNLLWLNTYGGMKDEITSSFDYTNDGGYVLIGFTCSYGDTLGDIYIVRTNSVGDTIWTKHYGGNDAERGYNVYQVADGGFVFSGYTNSFGAGGEDFYLCKIDGDGNLLWQKTFGGVNDEVPWCMQQTDDAGFILAGFTKSFGAGLDDGWVVKVDSLGNEQWSHTYGDICSDNLYHIDFANDNGYIMSGNRRDLGSQEDWYFVKIDSLGSQQWWQTYGDLADQVSGSIIQCSDSGYVIVGRSNSSGNYDAELIKTDVFGNIPVGIENTVSNTNSVLVYPNPTTGVFHLAVTNLQPGKDKMEIADMLGNIIYSVNVDSYKTEVDLTGRALGIYFVRFITEKKTYSIKILRQ